MLFEIGKVLPGFPFVVIISTKRKIETDPEGVGALLRAMKRSLESLKNEKERVAAAVIKKGTFGDAATVRKTVYQFSDLYSVAISQGRNRSVDRRGAHRSRSEKVRRR